jgi:hypothetical protein
LTLSLQFDILCTLSATCGGYKKLYAMRPKISSKIWGRKFTEKNVGYKIIENNRVKILLE